VFAFRIIVAINGAKYFEKPRFCVIQKCSDAVQDFA
jgi:hypothetical protein